MLVFLEIFTTGFSFGGGTFSAPTAPTQQLPTSIVPAVTQAQSGLTVAPNQFVTQQPQTGFSLGSTTTQTAAPPAASAGIKLNFGGTPNASTSSGMWCETKNRLIA